MTTASPTNPHFKGAWSDTATYNVNDIVVFPGPNPPASAVPASVPTTPYAGPSYTFIVVNPAGLAAGQPPPATFNSTNVMTTPTAAQLLNWQLQPWSTNPTKANVNTATFRELFRAFWCVMAGNPSNTTPFGYTGIDAYNIYDPIAPTASAPTVGNPQTVFRSPLRDPIGSGTANVSLLDIPTTTGGATPVTSVTNTNVMLLRAALGAVNALGLRDNSQNVISRTIVLQNKSQIDGGTPAPTQAQVQLQVYSNAPQPVISEVYVNTYIGPDSNLPASSNPQGYVAVELYNPYSVTLTLKNWQLGLINRSAVGTPNFPNVYPNLGFQTFPANVPSSTPSVSVIGPMQALNDPTQDSLVVPPTGTIIIPAHGYALLENYNVNGINPLPGDAQCRPANAAHGPVATPPATPGSFWLTASGTAVQQGIWYGPTGQGVGAVLPNTCDVYVPNLQLVINGTTGIAGASSGGELVLLRPRRADGTYTASTDPQNTFNEGTIANPNLYDLVPVDSYDFTGLTVGTSATGSAWSYIRIKGAVAATWFKQIFPGFYAVNSATPTAPREAAAPTPTAGTDSEIAAGGLATWLNTAATPSFGFDSLTGSYQNNFPPVQIYNATLGNAAGDWMHFPNAVVSPQHPASTLAPGQTYLHPLGGFARNGDMLDIPFVRAYRIRIDGGPLDQVNTQLITPPSTPPYFLELNSLPKDCSLAAVITGNAAIDALLEPAQNIGRFVPMSASSVYANAIQTKTPPAGTSFPLSDYYSWTKNLFNYLTVQSSSDTYLPNIDPNIALSSPPTAPTFAYPPQNGATPIPPTPTLTANPIATDQTAQDNVGVEGLININTASWKVLSMLPLVPNSPLKTQQLAQAIVQYRVANGPFTSIFDLNQVPQFQSAEGTISVTGPTSATGLISPADPAFETTTAANATPPLGTQEDYQGDCLELTRISNLITTRSDTFTIYVVLQGWQNVGTAQAQPMVTRRFAYIVDRSAVNADPTTRFLKTLTVPND